MELTYPGEGTDILEPSNIGPFGPFLEDYDSTLGFSRNTHWHDLDDGPFALYIMSENVRTPN
jgi:hypothetical protein